MKSNKLSISKSRFVSGVQCTKKLFFDKYRKDLKLPVDPKKQALFDFGHKIGHMAQLLFPDGKDATPENYYDLSGSVAKTKQWIESGEETIYEATFSNGEVLALLDILHHNGNERWAIEVKGSTEVKEYHLIDGSLQYWIMNNTGFRPDKFFIMHINNQYVKKGELDLEKFFHLEDITEEVLSKQDWVESQIESLMQMLKDASEPNTDIGTHCGNLFECDYKHHCWKHIPEKQSVFDLSRASGKEWQLYNDGIYSLIDIPDDFELTHRQQMQVNAAKGADSHIDIDAIKEHLKSYESPLYFFDFETIFPAIPILDGTKPFQQVTFQYSLHVTDEEGNITKSTAFLADSSDFHKVTSKTNDPRYKLIQQLKQDIGDNGSIVAYNAPFEIARLNELIDTFPEEKEFIEGLIERFVDLLVPFRSTWYYTVEMGASASIKSVLPAIDPAFSYEGLEISDGGLASETFLAMVNDSYKGDVIKTRENLLKYCERDTEGMVIIYRHLKNLINGD